MKRLRWTLVLTCFVLMPMPPVAALADDPDEPITKLEKMTVSAQREDQAIKDVDEREHMSGGQLTTLDDYILVNAAADYRVWEGASAKLNLYLAADNIFDEDYEEKEGYPMAGATVIGGIRMEF